MQREYFWLARATALEFADCAKANAIETKGVTQQLKPMEVLNVVKGNRVVRGVEENCICG